MTEAVASDRPNVDNAARKMLQTSGAFWFLTVVAGQWLFVCYIAGFYMDLRRYPAISKLGIVTGTLSMDMLLAIPSATSSSGRMF
jgi:hypothetical protein